MSELSNIYTSYFANVPNLPYGARLISISRTMPSWIYENVYQLEEAKPTWDMINAYNID